MCSTDMSLPYINQVLCSLSHAHKAVQCISELKHLPLSVHHLPSNVLHEIKLALVQEIKFYPLCRYQENGTSYRCWENKSGIFHYVINQFSRGLCQWEWMHLQWMVKMLCARRTAKEWISYYHIFLKKEIILCLFIVLMRQ